MARVAIDRLAAGMQLRKGVCNLNGVLLLREGETLTAKHLAVLKTWGVHEVDVCPVEGEAEATAIPPAVLMRVEQETARRFRHAALATHPVMGMIAQAASRRIAARLRRDGEVDGERAKEGQP